MQMPDTFSFGAPIKVNCGRQSLAHLPVELAAVNAAAPLVLASQKQIGRKKVNTVINAFKTSGLTLGVFDQLPSRMEPALLKALAEIYHNGGCDSLIAVGGEHVVDAAKCLNMVVSTNSFQWMNNPNNHLDDPGLLKPLMLVATPGGNGYEASAYGGDGSRRWYSPRMMPSGAFIDPIMMEAYDDRDIVNGALIALCQAVEAYIEESTGPICDAFAHAAIGLIVSCLPKVLRQDHRKSNLCAVVNGQVAAACAFSASPPGICYRMAAQFSELSDLSAGFLTAALLPHRLAQAGSVRPASVGRLLLPLVGENVFALIATKLQVPRLKAFFWEFFDVLSSELEMTIPTSLEQAGLSNEQIDVVQSRNVNNPSDGAVGVIIDAARKGGMLMAGQADNAAGVS